MIGLFTQMVTVLRSYRVRTLRPSKAGSKSALQCSPMLHEGVPGLRHPPSLPYQGIREGDGNVEILTEILK